MRARAQRPDPGGKRIGRLSKAGQGIWLTATTLAWRPGAAWQSWGRNDARSVHWIWGERIVMAWILTLPCSAFIAAVAYLVISAVRTML